MALKICTECDGTISDTAPVCPHCGHLRRAMLPDLPAVSQKPSSEEATQKVVHVGCAVLLVLFCGWMIIPDCSGSEASRTRTPGHARGRLTNDDYIAFANKTVMGYLKSPASAKFPSDDASYRVSRSSSGTVSIMGHVDSHNSFGAMIRSRFTVILRSTDNPPTTIYVMIDDTVMLDRTGVTDDDEDLAAARARYQADAKAAQERAAPQAKHRDAADTVRATRAAQERGRAAQAERYDDEQMNAAEHRAQVRADLISLIADVERQRDALLKKKGMAGLLRDEQRLLVSCEENLGDLHKLLRERNEEAELLGDTIREAAAAATAKAKAEKKTALAKSVGLLASGLLVKSDWKMGIAWLDLAKWDNLTPEKRKEAVHVFGMLKALETGQSTSLKLKTSPDGPLLAICYKDGKPQLMRKQDRE